eukprot:GHRR01034619.1.p1 GENE.GHRR01034619.1~~GHRR01034619.1.p1  ORF type:complete len:121 (-),score=25.30 GHRR01034619.1:303-665(-)
MHSTPPLEDAWLPAVKNCTLHRTYKHSYVESQSIRKLQQHVVLSLSPYLLLHVHTGCVSSEGTCCSWDLWGWCQWQWGRAESEAAAVRSSRSTWQQLSEHERFYQQAAVTHLYNDCPKTC